MHRRSGIDTYLGFSFSKMMPIELIAEMCGQDSVLEL